METVAELKAYLEQVPDHAKLIFQDGHSGQCESTVTFHVLDPDDDYYHEDRNQVLSDLPYPDKFPDGDPILVVSQDH